MTQITGGRVVYGRTVQPAQFESKRSEVELTFSVEDGNFDEAALDKVIETAITKAHEMVGVAPAPKSTRKAKVDTTSLTKVEVKTLEEKPKGDDIALDVLNTEKASAEDAKIKAAAALNAKDEKKAKADALDDLLGDVTATPAKTYTDMDLVDVVNKTNAAISNPPAIKAVCRKYTAQAIKDIPQDKRAAFVADLEALLAAGKTAA